MTLGGFHWLAVFTNSPDGYLHTAINSGQNVSAAWEAYSPLDPVDNVFSRHFLLEQMRQNGSFDEEHGTVIRANLEYATNPNVRFIAAIEAIPTSNPDTFDNAEFAWKFLAGDVPLTDFESNITEGGAGKYDFKARKLENLKNSMEEKANTSFFSDGTGTTSKEFGGLQLLVSTTPTTGTVGLISRATFSFWRNQSTTATATSTPGDTYLAALTRLYNNCSNGIGMENPTYVISDQASFQIYEGLTPAIERLLRTTTNDKLVRGFKGQNVMFKDCEYGYDNACPAGTSYVLNNRNLRFIWMQWMKGEPAIRPMDAFYSVFKILTIGNLITDNSRRLGVCSAIT